MIKNWFFRRHLGFLILGLLLAIVGFTMFAWWMLWGRLVDHDYSFIAASGACFVFCGSVLIDLSRDELPVSIDDAPAPMQDATEAPVEP